MAGNAVVDSVEASLKRLQAGVIDLIQFHGGMYTQDDYDHIFNGGPLDGLRELKESGKVRFIGLTVEEPWTARPFVASGEFDVVQVRYNRIFAYFWHAALTVFFACMEVGTPISARANAFPVGTISSTGQNQNDSQLE